MKSYFLAACAGIFALIANLAAGAEVPFDKSQFDAARSSGKPVAVVFHADWCPTCRAQAPVLMELSQTVEFKALTLYVANFDSERALKKSLGVVNQSTIVVFRNGREVARSTGETRRGSLAALLREAIR